MPKAFISYSSDDRAFVESHVIPWLDAIRVEPWFAPDAIRPSDRWEDSIHSGLENTDWFIVIVSRKTASSEWVRKEIDCAFNKMPGKIIQIQIDDCDPGAIDRRLSDVQQIRCESDPIRAMQRLVQTFVDAEYAVIHRQLEGRWTSAVQPVYYAKETKWHVQEVDIFPTKDGYAVETKPADGKLQWRLEAKLVATHFLVGRWRSKRIASTSNGYMTLQIARNGLYMCGHDYAILVEEGTAHFGVLLLAKDEDNLQNAWTAMALASRELLPLNQRTEFNTALSMP